ncbi:hypothetical protein BgiMline_005211 [Biomphalaria glabrata]|nr:hypothetical protein BgiMline_003283 [Biomphalaria glabrata]
MTGEGRQLWRRSKRLLSTTVMSLLDLGMERSESIGHLTLALNSRVRQVVTVQKVDVLAECEIMRLQNEN